MKRFFPCLMTLLVLLFLLAFPIAAQSAGEAGGGEADIPALLTPDGAMGDQGFVSLLFQSMDPLAVIVAIALTQLVKILLPSPIPGDRSTETVGGSLSNRILPFVPVLIGCTAVFLQHWGQPFRQSLVQGIVSGVAAAYFYRAWKVTIFGV